MFDDVIDGENFVNKSISEAVYEILIKCINRRRHLADIELRNVTEADSDEFFLDDGTRIVAGHTKYMFPLNTTTTEMAIAIDRQIDGTKPKLIVYRGSKLGRDGFEIDMWMGGITVD